MLRQAGESQTVTVNTYGGVGGNGGRGGQRGGNGGTGEGPTTNFGSARRVTVIHNYRARRLGSIDSDSSEGASEFAGPSRNLHGRPRQTPYDRPVHAYSRLNDNGVKIIARKNLKLIREIGSGPGYLLHAGQHRDRAVIVKVFNAGPSPTLQRKLDLTVALAKKVLHPNVFDLYGISSSNSLDHHFIVYENVRSQNAEGPLALALKTDLKRSITLGFKMMAELAAGLNYLFVQGVCLGSMGAENFDVLLDVDDRFGIIIDPPEEGVLTRHAPANFQEREENAWVVFTALCQKILISANRAVHRILQFWMLYVKGQACLRI
ncbi:hypothetical protein K438DRAFT_8266 [Mycena galopus ATCC 62051]|nr:hypothetical protein K438DRAFT_8266 [Mycena galopus ATCC 62051]